MLVNDETEKEMTSEKSMNSNLSSIFQSEIIVNTADNDFLFEDYQDYSNFDYLIPLSVQKIGLYGSLNCRFLQTNENLTY